MYSPLAWLIPLAIVVKFYYLFFAQPDANSVAALSIDALYHYNWASLIASGDIFANAPYFRAPLYPFLLAIFLKISGGSLLFVKAIQLLAGVLTLLICYRLAERLASRAAAVCAFLLVLLYPLTTYFEAELLLDAPFTLFFMIALFALVPDEENDILPGVAGVFFGLAALTRPTILVFAPFVVIYLWLRRRHAEAKAGIHPLLVFTLLAAIVIAPVTIINYTHSGQPILVSYQGGINFYIGNNTEADGITASLPPVGQNWTLEDASYLAHQKTGKVLRYNRQSWFWYEQGLSFIGSHPGQFMDLLIKKFYLLFSGHEISNNRPLQTAVFENSLLRFLPVRFSMIVGLAILPVFIDRKNIRRYWFLYGIALIYGLTVALFFVNSRFRQPLVPLCAIPAGIGVAVLWQTIWKRQIGYRLFWGVIAAAGLYIIAESSLYTINPRNPGYSLFLRGNQALRDGDYATAITRYDSLTSRTPYQKNTYLNMGIAYLKLGNSAKAETAFRDELKHNPQSAEAANNIAALFYLRKQDDSTKYYSRLALNLKPYYPEAAAHFLRTAVRDSLPRQVEADETLRRRIRTYMADNPFYLFEEALYFTGRGQYAQAIDDHLKAINLWRDRETEISFEAPYSVESHMNRDHHLALVYYQLGYLHGLLGRFKESVTFSRKAIELSPQMKEAYINLISGYRSLNENIQADSVAAEFLARWPEGTK